VRIFRLMLVLLYI